MIAAAFRLLLPAAGCLAGAGLLAAALLNDPAGGETAAVPPPASSPAVVPPGFALAALDAFSATLERPLFQRGRRPVAGVAASRKAGGRAGAAAAPRLSVAGIAIARGQRIALVQLEGAKDLLPLGEGGQVSGWTVVEVLPDRIRLSRGTEAVEQALRDFKKAK